MLGTSRSLFERNGTCSFYVGLICELSSPWDSVRGTFKSIRARTNLEESEIPVVEIIIIHSMRVIDVNAGQLHVTWYTQTREFLRLVSQYIAIDNNCDIINNCDYSYCGSYTPFTFFLKSHNSCHMTISNTMSTHNFTSLTQTHRANFLCHTNLKPPHLLTQFLHTHTSSHTTYIIYSHTGRDYFLNKCVCGQNPVNPVSNRNAITLHFVCVVVKMLL